MTGQQLARRLGVDPSSVTRMEISEVKRTISLSSLDRAAEQLGCRVVYALVPHESLDTTVINRARLAAARLRKTVAHSMSLEDQSLDQQAARDSEELLADELMARLDPVIWETD
jgi:predicted DNA-binding mobile mystery protein A